jgi:hypothetical protein
VQDQRPTGWPGRFWDVAKQGIEAVDGIGGAVLEQSAVPGEGEGDAVVPGPFRHLADVAAGGNQNRDEAVS